MGGGSREIILELVTAKILKNVQEVHNTTSSDRSPKSTA